MNKPHLFQPGNPGKPKGAVNKTMKSIKDTVFDVFHQLQVDPKANLLTWAAQEPTEFYKIAAKLIPTDIKADITQVHEIQLKIQRGKTIVEDISHEEIKSITNDQGSSIESAGVPFSPAADIRPAEAIQRSELGQTVRQDRVSPGPSPWSR